MPITYIPNDDQGELANISLGQKPTESVESGFNPQIPDRASQLFDPSVIKNPAGNNYSSTFDNIQVGDIFTTYQTGGFATYNPGTDGPIAGVRRFNPLNAFASYTYNIGLYMLTPDAYNAFVASGRKTLTDLGVNSNGVQLLCQSGGINNSTQNRAEGFETDYYIDNLVLKNVAANIGNGDTTAGVYEISFSIFEPYGFSLISDFKKAADWLQQFSQTGLLDYQELQNPLRQLYVLGIKFIGYDDQGNVVDGNNIQNGMPGSYGNNLGINERFFDISITDFRFKLDGKPVRYDVKAVARPAQAFTSKRGRLPKETSIGGDTITSALTGEKGLLTQLNKMNFDFIDAKQAMYANFYDVKFLGPGAAALANAKLVTEGSINAYNFNTLVSKARQPAESTDALGIAAEPDPAIRTFSFTQNTSIIQAIEEVIKNSEYMVAALKVVQENTIETNPLLKSIRQKRTQTKKSISWYSVSAELSNPQYDPIMRDWAYDITYIIETYSTPVITSPFVSPDTKFYGHHKSYQYWYTGQNTEVLSYEMNFNNAYFINVAAPTPAIDAALSTSRTASEASAPVSPGRRAPGSNMNTLGAGLQAQNHFLTTLYDAAAIANAKIQIMGDPDFLSTGGSIPIEGLYGKFYEADGFTVSANGGQVFIEIIFMEGVDYNDSTGVLDINDSILFFESESARQFTKGVSHQVVSVVSSFTGGKFTQVVDCKLNSFELLAQALNQPSQARPNENQASDSTSNESTVSGFKPDDPVTDTDTNNFEINYPQTLSDSSDDDTFATDTFNNIRVGNVIDPGGREPEFNFNTGPLGTPNRFGNIFGGP